VGPTADIFNVRAGHLVIGNRGQMPGEQTHFGRSQSDLFHHPVMTLHDNTLPHLVGFIQEDHDAGDKVFARRVPAKYQLFMKNDQFEFGMYWKYPPILMKLKRIQGKGSH
jgi:hypothetical protein